MLCVTDKNLPASFQEADAESKSAQKIYVRLFIGLLLATLIGAGATWISTDFESIKMYGSLVAAVSTFTAFALTTVLSIRSYEKIWYRGRAVAESIKTRSWSFMMCGERYPSSLDQVEVTKRFIDDVSDILKEKGPVILINSSDATFPQISPLMLELRNASVEERLAAYVSCRVLDQKTWYKKKAKLSSRYESYAFLAMQASQLISLLIVGCALYEKRVTSGSVGLLAALSSSVLAWLQVKRYQETAESYSIAYQELSSIESLSVTVHTDIELAQFVQDAENAVSREHTLWVAKRVLR
jgi:hypothetical protein